MKPWRRLIKRIGSWGRRREDEDRLRAEIDEHIALQTADNIRAGLPPAEARRLAVLKFGAVEAVREEYRDQRGLPILETLILDTRYGLRRLRKAPAFTLTVVFTLALGIGATTAIFTLVHAVIFKSLAVARPAELYRLGKHARCCYYGGYSQKDEFSLVSYDLYKYFRDHTKGLAELAAFAAATDLDGVRRSGTPEAAQSCVDEYVSGNYFTMFGIRPYAGRLLAPGDDGPGAPPVAVMSYRLWEQKYGADPTVVGSVFNLSNKPFTIVGIAPPKFFGDTLRNDPPDLFLPLARSDNILEPSTHFLELIGRIQPGATAALLEAQMRVELKQWLRSHWGDMSANDRALFPEQTLFLEPGGAGISHMRDEYDHWLQILMAASGFVLLIVCANVANLLLVRGMEQRRQISLSMALGAPVSRLVKQALAESLLLSFAGGAAGLAIAYAASSLILHFAFPANSVVPISAAPSMPVLLFAVITSVLTGVVFGIAPAWMTTRVHPIEALRSGGRTTARRGSLSRRMLVAFQSALALVLLSASGLLTAALYHLEHEDFGFAAEGRIVVHANPILAGYEIKQLDPLYRGLQESIAGIPGVSAVAFCTYSPMSGNEWGTRVRVNGHPPPGPKDDEFVSWNRVTAGYFAVTGNPIVRGRAIDERDNAASEHVAVINQSFARKFFNGQDPIGKYFGRYEMGDRLYKVIGVAKDARYTVNDLGKPEGPFFFLPADQHDFTKIPGEEASSSTHYLGDIIITAKPGANVTHAQLRQAMASVNPNLPILSIRSLENQVAGTFRQQRLIARLTSLFGLLSLVLASIGLYGVTAYNAGRRVNEIGVRMALGADRRQVAGLILSGAFGMILAGLLIGLPLSLAAGRFLGNELYGVNPYNPVVIAVAVTALGFSALIAAMIPALRASSILPLEALREE